VRQPFWADYLLIPASLLYAAALFAMPTAFLGVRERLPVGSDGRESRRIVLSFILFLYACFAIAVGGMVARIAFVSHAAVQVLRVLAIWQLAATCVGAAFALWLCIVVLRPAFREHALSARLERMKDDE
jgi:hypothetical protein